jgi:hypothetical protein
MNHLSHAQESQFNPSHYSESLTAFTRDWKDAENIEALLNFIAPKVPVSRRFEYKQTDTDQMFFSEHDDLRAQGSSFKRIEFYGQVVQAKTLNKGLTIRVDVDDIVGADWQERYVHLLMKRLYRNELRRAIAALKANANRTEKTWSSESIPDKDIRECLLQSAYTHGFYPNRILWGELAWYKRQDCYCAQENTSAYIVAELPREKLAEKLLVDEIKLLKKQNLGIQGDEIQGNEIFAFFTQNGLLKDEPSHIKRFVTPTEGDNLFRVYVEEHSKFTDITVEHYSNLAVTSAEGITQIDIQS